MPLPSTMTPIATNTLNTAVATITFSSVPQGYTDLVLVVNAKGATASNLRIQFNGDTATNYSRTVLYGTGAAGGSSRTSTFASIPIDAYAQLDTSNFVYNSTTSIQNYSNSTTYKTTLTRANSASLGTDCTVGLWRSTAAITSITIFTNDSGNYSIGTTFTLYGIKAA